MPDPRNLLDPACPADEFTAVVALFKFGKVFKTTSSGRFKESLQAITAVIGTEPVAVLDLGASDGSTSLDVLKALNCERYFLTDLHLEAEAREVGGWTLFTASDGAPLLAVGYGLAVFADSTGTYAGVRWLVGQLLTRLVNRPPKWRRTVALVNPAVRDYANPEPEILEYNALEPWHGPRVDLVIIANLLNATYFTDAQLTRIVRNAMRALNSPGFLAIIDNRSAEACSILQLSGSSAEVVARIRAGAETEALALAAAVRPD